MIGILVLQGACITPWLSEKYQGLRSILEGSTYTLCVCPMFPGGGSEDFGEIVSALRARWP